MPKLVPPSLPLHSARTIAVLAVTQIISWGTTFDMLGVLGRVGATAVLLTGAVLSAISLAFVLMLAALVRKAHRRAAGFNPSS